MGLCEENYEVLLRILPDLKGLTGSRVASATDGLHLHLDVLDQAPYTTLLRLTHYFPARHVDVQPEPDAYLRVYHDAQQVEVLSLHSGARAILSAGRCSALQDKWRANLFLAKWLRYCRQQRYVFPADRSSRTAVPDREPSMLGEVSVDLAVR
ncbi:DUF1249 domain-containing protein [Thioalkalicoccus limnaeus]